MADAGKEGSHKPLMGRSYGNGANVQSVRACALEARGRQRPERMGELHHARRHVRANIRFVMNPKIRACDDGNTDEGRKRS
jgi:hypothetical protein